MGDTELYSVLGVSKNATLSDIKKVFQTPRVHDVETATRTDVYYVACVEVMCVSLQAYHRLARQHHPDKGGSDEKVMDIASA